MDVRLRETYDSFAVQNDSNFARFLRRRSELQERLDETRLELDEWIGHCNEIDPSATQLAHLAGLLQIRSGLFAEIKVIDDELFDYLLELRGHRSD